MKDLIRKILKESEDEFEWTKDVISSSPSFEIGTFLNLRGKLFKNLGRVKYSPFLFSYSSCSFLQFLFLTPHQHYYKVDLNF